MILARDNVSSDAHLGLSFLASKTCIKLKVIKMRGRPKITQNDRVNIASHRRFRVLLTTMVRIRKAIGCSLERLLPKDS